MLLLLVGCQSESEPDPGTDTQTDTQTDTETDAGTVEVTAVNYAFEGVPETVETGTELTLTNASTDELHELVLVRLPDDEQRPVSELVQLPEAEVEPIMAGLKGVSVAPPESDGMVVEGALVADEPGRYALLCFVPTGADPQEFMDAAAEAEGGPPEVEGGPPHVAHGMFAELTVE